MEQLQYQLYHPPNVNPPSWTEAETRAILSIRSELDRAFMETKRNKPLWESVSASMHRKGFRRTPDQCKSKWKNLVTRFKASDADANHQFTFYPEMQQIYADRMSRMLGFNKDESDEEVEEERSKGRKKKKKKTKRKRGGEVEALLGELMRWQREAEARWVEEAEAREAERRLKEEEWRRVMEGIWEERAEMERQWREREEGRRSREEARSERRNALLTALLAKLAGEGD